MNVNFILRRSSTGDFPSRGNIEQLRTINQYMTVKFYILDAKDPIKKKHFRARASQYMERAEKIKSLIDERKAAGKYREQTRIEAGTTGHGYASLFGRFLDASVTHIHIEDPYIRTFHQVTEYIAIIYLNIQHSKNV